MLERVKEGVCVFMLEGVKEGLCGKTLKEGLC